MDIHTYVCMSVGIFVCYMTESCRQASDKINLLNLLYDVRFEKFNKNANYPNKVAKWENI